MLEVGRDIPASAPLPEDRFTWPTELCPNPGRWTSTDGDSTEREVADLVYGLVRGLQPDSCLETGTAFAEVAVRIGNALRSNGHGRLYTIENDPERLEYAHGLLLHDCTSLIESDSLAWTPPEGVIFDFAWFDSWYELRVPEFRRYKQWMRPGSIVCFHDTAPGHGAHRLPDSDIRSVIGRELRREIRMIHLPTPRGLTIGEVL